MQYELIEIDIKKFTGAFLRLALHWSAHSLSNGGILSFTNVEKGGFGFGIHSLREWQVQSILSALAFRGIEQVQSSPERISFQKKLRTIAPEGVSVCIVSSNDPGELLKLRGCIEAILASESASSLSLQIVICLTQSDKKVEAEINESCRGICDVRFIYHDCARNGRVYIAEKKAKLWNEAHYELRVVLHTRILVLPGFLKELERAPVQVAAPNVVAANSLPYLDFVYLRTLDNAETSRATPLLGSYLRENYYVPLSKGWKPYVDGGICIFNSGKIGFNPYETIAEVPWGEAEDVAMIRVLAARGIVVDYLHELKCCSSTSKFYYHNGAKLFFQLFRERFRHCIQSSNLSLLSKTETYTSTKKLYVKRNFLSPALRSLRSVSRRFFN